MCETCVPNVARPACHAMCCTCPGYTNPTLPCPTLPLGMIDALLENDMHDVLVHNDQLKWSFEQKLVGSTFIEPPLHFRPTYKYDFHSDLYDTSTKSRIPSWTDRILYVPEGLQCLAYNADESIKTSDHRPVHATFVVQVAFPSEHEVATPNKRAREAPVFSSESQVCAIS